MSPSAPTRPGPPASPNARQRSRCVPAPPAPSPLIALNLALSLTLPCSSPSCFSPPILLFPLLRGGWGAGRSRVFQGAGISASATTAKPEVSCNRSRCRDPRLDRRLLNMEFKGGKKPTPNSSPCTCSPQKVPTAREGSEAGQESPRAAAGSGEERGTSEAMVFGGNRGAGPPQPARRRAQGRSRVGGCHRKAGHPRPQRGTALAEDVTAQLLAERGDPQFHPGAPRPPFPARLRACWESSGKKGHMPKPFPETNNHPRGNGHAWAPERALPLLPSSGRAPRKCLEFTAGAPSPRLHPQCQPRA